MGILEKWTVLALENTPRFNENIIKKLKSSNNETTLSKNNNTRKFTLNDFYSIFLIWFIGIGFSLVAFLVEYLSVKIFYFLKLFKKILIDFKLFVKI